MTKDAGCSSTSVLSIYRKEDGDRRGLATRGPAVKPCQALPGVGVGRTAYSNKFIIDETPFTMVKIAADIRLRETVAGVTQLRSVFVAVILFIMRQPCLAL